VRLGGAELRRPLRVPGFAAVLSFAALTSHAWAQLPLGPEFQVNTYTTSSQSSPAIASDSSGNFVIVWDSDSQDGSNGGIFARKYLASGVPLGSSEFRVNTYTFGHQSNPSVASDTNGGLVIVWSGLDGSSGGVLARRFNPAGTPGPEFQVNTYTTSGQSNPAVAMDDGGDFVVAWNSSGQDGSSTGVFARRYDAAGVPQGSEFQVNTYTTGPQYLPSVAMDANGDFAVAWNSFAQGGSAQEVFARRYNAAGVPQGAEFQVNSYTSNNQIQPSITMDKDGGIIVVWGGTGPDGSGSGVLGRRFNASGVPQGSEFQVNQYTTGFQGTPRVSADRDGKFVVAWLSYQDGDAAGVFTRAFDAAGVPEGGELQVNQFTTSLQTRAALTSQPSGRFVVSWASYGQDGSSYTAMGRRFAKDLIFQDGFESGDLSRWSSAATDGGDLLPSVVAAMKFTSVGLEGVVDDTASLYVEDDTPIDEDRYRARFYFNTNGFDPGESGGAHRTRIFIVFEEAPTRRLAAIVLKRLGSVYSVMGRARLDDDSQADTGFFDVSDGPHVVELDWKRSSSASANDGTFELWIDGVSRSQLTGLDNSRSAVDFARLGALSIKPTAAGTLFWDEFESRRLNFIGN
jgi:hypothetical protein